MAKDPDDDLLGLQSLHPDRESAADQNTMSVNVDVVELGSSLDRGRGGDNTAAESASRRRRKQSPVTKLLRASIGRKNESRSLRRRGTRSGETPYQGRMTRRHKQPAQQQQQNQSQQQQQQYRQAAANIGTEIRRKSRDGAERVRRHVSRRRLSPMRNDNDSELQLQRPRDEARMRQRDGSDGNNGNRGNKLWRQMSKSLRHALGNDMDSDDIESGVKPRRKTRSSVGADGHELQQQKDKNAAMNNNSQHDDQDLPSGNLKEEQTEPSSSMPRRSTQREGKRHKLIRASSLDTSMRDLQVKIDDESINLQIQNEDEDVTSRRRSRPRRRNSLESSLTALKLEEAGKSELLPRRSSSAGPPCSIREASDNEEEPNIAAEVNNCKRTSCTVDSFENKSRSDTPSVEEEDPSVEITRKKKNTGFRVSRFMMCMACLCYLISILMFCSLGFWLHMTVVAHNDDSTSSSNGRESNDGSSGPNTNDKGQSGINPERPSHNNTGQSNTTNDGSFVTKQSPSTLTPSYSPLSRPSLQPSAFPSPSLTPQPSTPPSTTSYPTMAPSYSPSFSPTSSPGCPDQLLKYVTLDDDKLLTMRYEVIIYPGDTKDGLGGLLCVSLEYTGGAAGWIGLAFSEASRAPQFGRKEAIIGIPGVQTSLAVDADGGASLGQQNVGLKDGPEFVNPAKYVIPAGGIGEDGYYGPSLKLLSHIDKQTLINGSVSTMNGYLDPGGVVFDNTRTKTSFVKYLRESGEIEIDPFGSTLLLYAVAAIPLDGNGEYDGNPEWKSTYFNFLGSSSNNVKSGLVRKRERQHNVNT